MYFALFYDVVDDFVNRRAPFRQQHLERARDSHARGHLVLAGALDEPVDGAVLVFRAQDRSLVEEFVAGDPYVNQGLVPQWRIRPWTVVVGGEE
jgi:uncharacterized protein YciI